MKRGRPKGESRDNRSFGPLGDLIRTYRMKHKLGLSDVSKACDCSVQFISNIEHGRAPLPWEKAELLAKVLQIPLQELQAANLAVRADFKGFLGGKSQAQRGNGSIKGTKIKKSATALGGLTGLKDAASLVALTAEDDSLRDLLQRYQSANAATRKKFYQTARKLLSF